VFCLKKGILEKRDTLTSNNLTNVSIVTSDTATTVISSTTLSTSVANKSAATEASSTLVYSNSQTTSVLVEGATATTTTAVTTAILADPTTTASRTAVVATTVGNTAPIVTNVTPFLTSTVSAQSSEQNGEPWWTITMEDRPSNGQGFAGNYQNIQSQYGNNMNGFGMNGLSAFNPNMPFGNNNNNFGPGYGYVYELLFFDNQFNKHQLLNVPFIRFKSINNNGRPFYSNTNNNLPSDFYYQSLSNNNNGLLNNIHNNLGGIQGQYMTYTNPETKFANAGLFLGQQQSQTLYDVIESGPQSFSNYNNINSGGPGMSPLFVDDAFFGKRSHINNLNSNSIRGSVNQWPSGFNGNYRN
jgi:hypothetical protein